ncbi:hypothetical protein FH972_016489 [Carpinus fangiana]|uniref:Uncharacterized protein n=1 Tax=Carpinus fangiana TaxID=176857 RepID=A0A5N6RHA3_9ROSI|nr:hypothetical protein FH972_016489 [Carpinus fangiana]
MSPTTRLLFNGQMTSIHYYEIFSRHSESFSSVVLTGEKFGNIQAQISEAPESIYLLNWPLLPWDIIDDDEEEIKVTDKHVGD